MKTSEKTISRTACSHFGTNCYLVRHSLSQYHRRSPSSDALTLGVKEDSTPLAGQSQCRGIHSRWLNDTVGYGAAQGEEEDLEAFAVLMARQAPRLRGLVIVSALGIE